MAVIVCSEVEKWSKKSLTLEDELKVEDAVVWINKRVEETAMRGLVEIGDHILTTFFNNDPAEASSYNPRKSVSFSCLVRHPNLMVSRSTLQKAVGLAILKRNHELNALSLLPTSHLASLLPMSKTHPELLLPLAEKAASENWSVRRLKNEIRGIRNTSLCGEKEKRIEQEMKTIKRKIARFIGNVSEEPLSGRMLILLRQHMEKCLDLLKQQEEKRKALGNNDTFHIIEQACLP